MTDKVNPSLNRPANPFKTAGAISLAGASDGWISRAASPSDISVQDSEIDDTVLNAFSQTSSTSSFDVTVDPGEAFVYGSWLAIDTTTTVTLASSTAAQTVYVGWNKDSADDVIIGLQSAFDNATGNTDKKIPLFDFDTDGSGVTASTDRRELGKHIDIGDIELYYDSATDSLTWGDETDNTERMALDRTTGDLTITGEITENTSL
jgi:hypothetical protein